MAVLFLVCAGAYNSLITDHIHVFQFLYFFSSFWGQFGERAAWGGALLSALGRLRMQGGCPGARTLALALAHGVLLLNNARLAPPLPPPGPNATTWLLPAETAPTEMRSMCHGFAAAVGKAGALVAGVVFNKVSDRGKVRRRCGQPRCEGQGATRAAFPPAPPSPAVLDLWHLRRCGRDRDLPSHP